MNKRITFLLLGAFTFFYVLNYLMPLAFGDDYLYAFIWQGNPMYVPLTEDAVKISSFRDIISSQIAFYCTWSGRVVNNTLSQLFVWVGKDVFNVFNTFACVILALEIYWCANKGKVTFNFDIYRIAWIFLFFWIFTPSFPAVVLWLVGACHYLWPAVFLTGFLIPFVHKYYFLESRLIDNTWFKYFIFFFGIIAGCTNENSVCWLILLLTFFVFKSRKHQMFESWLYTGLAGLVLGYAVLMISPGNYVRLIVTHDNGWFNQTKILENLHILAVVLLIQFILWYFYLRSLTQISNTLHAHLETEKIELKKELILLKALSITSMGMSACMLFSPDFHLRSAFPGTVQLIIVVAIVLRIQKEYGIKLLEQNAKRFLICASVIYFAMSAGFTLQHLYEHHIYNELLVSRVKELKENSSKEKTILIMEPFSKPVIAKDFLSGFHTFNIDISQDVNYWTNVAFARFYDIKGIRVRDDSKEDFVSGNGLK